MSSIRLPSVYSSFSAVLVITLTLFCGTESASGTTLLPGFQESLFTGGLVAPTAMEFAPDGRLFVTEQAGRLRVIKNGTLLATPFVTVSAISSGEQGLLGIAFDPDYAVNRYVYVYYTSAQLVQNVVSRFTASATNPDVAQPGSELVLLQIPTNGNHVGGGIHFGLDRKLYIGVGDVGNSMNAQSLGTLAGKFLRIDPSTFPNIIPPNNPFVGTPGARGEIWALGLRNPFTSAVDPLTGTININDVGQGTWEEVNRARSGGNYGWPICEGPCSLERFINPVYAYSHPGMSAAITGGAFYRASQFPPAYAGAYFFSDYILGFIRALRSEGGVVNFATNANSPVDLKVGPNGQLYYLSIGNGAVYTIRFMGGD